MRLLLKKKTNTHAPTPLMRDGYAVPPVRVDVAWA
jgi:hypothetical protein